jgi:hypothetical protein
MAEANRGLYHKRKSNSPRTITVKFAGTCACCGAPIKAGEIADYYPDRRQIAHLGGLDGTSARCTAEIRRRRDPYAVGLGREP